MNASLYKKKQLRLPNTFYQIHRILMQHVKKKRNEIFVFKQNFTE